MNRFRPTCLGPDQYLNWSCERRRSQPGSPFLQINPCWIVFLVPIAAFCNSGKPAYIYSTNLIFHLLRNSTVRQGILLLWHGERRVKVNLISNCRWLSWELLILIILYYWRLARGHLLLLHFRHERFKFFEFRSHIFNCGSTCWLDMLARLVLLLTLWISFPEG